MSRPPGHVSLCRYCGAPGHRLPTCKGIGCLCPVPPSKLPKADDLRKPEVREALGMRPYANQRLSRAWRLAAAIIARIDAGEHAVTLCREYGLRPADIRAVLAKRNRLSSLGS